jgi:hypothetical protein
MVDDPDGSQVGGGSNASTEAYKAEPTIENYVNLRRADPEAVIEVGVIGGFEAMFYMLDEFERHGLDSELLGGVLDAHHFWQTNKLNHPNALQVSSCRRWLCACYSLPGWIGGGRCAGEWPLGFWASRCSLRPASQRRRPPQIGICRSRA